MQPNHLCNSTEKIEPLCGWPCKANVYLKFLFHFVQMGFRLIRTKISRGPIFKISRLDLTNRISECSPLEKAGILGGKSVDHKFIEKTEVLKNTLAQSP